MMSLADKVRISDGKVVNKMYMSLVNNFDELNFVKESEEDGENEGGR